jgi:hypothetical protein
MPKGVYVHKPRSEETKKKISETTKGVPKTLEVRQRIKEKREYEKILKFFHKKKIIRTLKHKQAVSQARKGKPSWNKGGHISEITREKLREIHMGKKASPQTKEKMSIARKGRFVGEKSWNWKGGLSFEPYSTDWTGTLKRAIRERDHYVCQLCGKLQSDEAFSIHHIDYDKKNCSPDNLITLCRKCHIKTNADRGKWKLYFMSKVI